MKSLGHFDSTKLNQLTAPREVEHCYTD